MGLLDPALRSATVLLMASVTKYVPPPTRLPRERHVRRQDLTRFVELDFVVHGNRSGANQRDLRAQPHGVAAAVRCLFGKIEGDGVPSDATDRDPLVSGIRPHDGLIS